MVSGPPWVSRYRGWLVVGAVVLLVLAVRIRLRDMPLERDEGEYAYLGQLMLHGVPPYKEAYTMKLPGTFAAYAVIMGIFGQTPAGIHVGVALVNVACIVLIFLIGRKILDEPAAMAAAVSFALMSLSPWVLGLAGHATHFVVLFALAGILLLISCFPRSLFDVPLSPTRSGSTSTTRAPLPQTAIAQDSPEPAGRRRSQVERAMLLRVVAGGLLIGVSILMKQHGALFALFGLLFLLFSLLSKESGKDSRGSRQRQSPLLGERARVRASHSRSTQSPWHLGLLFIAAVGLPYAFTCLLLAAAGALKPFIFWTVTYAGKYAAAVTLVSGGEILKQGVRSVLGPNIVFWTFPWFGAVLMWWDNRLSAHTRFVITAFTLCSLLSVSLGFYFREHYFIMLLPALSLLTGLTVSRALYLLKHDRTIELFLAVPLLAIFGIGIVASLGGNGSIWFAMSPTAAGRSVYGSTLFAATAKAADYLKTRVPETGRVAVLGSEPQIYFLTKRRAATGYIYMYYLMETHNLARQMQEEMIAEIERVRPEYFVYVDDDYSWLRRPDSEHKLQDWWERYWPKELELMHTINVEEGVERGVDDYKGMKDQPATETKHLLIFKRKAKNP